MIASVHALAGAALGVWLGRADVAVLAGVASHAVLDAVPHTDYASTRAGVLDAALGLALAVVLWVAGPGPAAGLGALAGMLPDVEVATHHLWGWPRRGWFPSHRGWTPHRQVPLPLGAWTQAAVALLAAAALAWR